LSLKGKAGGAKRPGKISNKKRLTGTGGFVRIVDYYVIAATQ
jgi:hypothetical protein